MSEREIAVICVSIIAGAFGWVFYLLLISFLEHIFSKSLPNNKGDD